MIHTCEQGTPEWLSLRAGKVTGSRISDVLATIKKGEAATRRNYRTEILVETLTGIPVDQFVSKEMQWGTDQEPFARAAYELHQDVMVSTVGFAVHPFIPRFGASPDGLLGEDGLVEIKCPNTSTHLEYLLAGVVPSDYEPQMLAGMACTGRAWCDFVSFDPRLPAHLQLFVRRFHRDELKIADMEGKVLKFLEEVDATIVQLGAVVPNADVPLPMEANQRRLLAEVKGCFDVYFTMCGKQEAQIRLAVCDLVFGVKALENLDEVEMKRLERGLRILHAYEKFPTHPLSSPHEVLPQIAEAIVEYDSGQSEEWESLF